MDKNGVPHSIHNFQTCCSRYFFWYTKIWDRPIWVPRIDFATTHAVEDGSALFFAIWTSMHRFGLLLLAGGPMSWQSLHSSRNVCYFFCLPQYVLLRCVATHGWFFSFATFGCVSCCLSLGCKIKQCWYNDNDCKHIISRHSYIVRVMWGEGWISASPLSDRMMPWKMSELWCSRRCAGCVTWMTWIRWVLKPVETCWNSVTCVWLLVLLVDLVPENLQSGKFYWPLRLLSPRLPFFLARNSRRHSVTSHNARTRFELQAAVLAGTNDAMMELAARAENTGTPSTWHRAEWKCFTADANKEIVVRCCQLAIYFPQSHCSVVCHCSSSRRICHYH